MSQAVAVVFAEYFQVDYRVNQDNSLIGGVSLARVEALEEQIRNLTPTKSSLPSDLLSKLQDLESLVLQIENRLSSLEAKQNSELLSRLPKESTDILPEVVEKEDNSVKQLNMLDSVDTLSLGDPSPSNLQQPDDSTIDEPQVGQDSSLPIEFTTKQLSLRLRVIFSSITQQKYRHKDNQEKFYDWMQSKDEDNIRWVESGSRGRLSLYKPASDTPSKLLSKLRSQIENLSVIH